MNSFLSFWTTFSLHLLPVIYETDDIIRDDNKLIHENSKSQIMFQIDKNCEIGRGAESFVYKGKFENKKIAVKRVFKRSYDNIERETNLLQIVDSHENIIRYFGTCSDSRFCDIGFELCDGSLENLVTKDIIKDFKPKNIMLQIVKGLNHLHDLEISEYFLLLLMISILQLFEFQFLVHRDLKPTNILYTVDNNEICIKISDFGISKKLSKYGTTTKYSNNKFCGTESWIAPETLEKKKTVRYYKYFNCTNKSVFKYISHSRAKHQICSLWVAFFTT